MNISLYIIISALIYCVSFCFVKYLGFLVIFSYFIIFNILSNSLLISPLGSINKPRYLNIFFLGFLWGLIIYLILLMPILLLFLQAGSEIYRFLAYLFLVIYGSLYSGLWFQALSYSYSILKNNIIKLIIAFMLITFIFIWWLENGILFIFGNFEGFCLLNPLVNLVNYRPIYLLIFYLGKSITLLILLSIVLISIFLLRNIKTKNFVINLSVISLFIIFYLFWKLAKPCKSLSYVENKYIRICSIKWDIKKTSYIWDAAHEIGNLLLKIKKENPEIKLIIFPESTFRFCLNKYPEVISYWYNLIGNEIDIIIGSHKDEDNKIYNTCYWLSNGKIKDFYNKHHGLFFAERIPNWCSNLDAKNIILLKSPPISQEKNNYKHFNINLEANNINFKISFFPLICSDIFFATKDFNNKQGSIILALINDAWCKNNFMSDLLFFCVRLYSCNFRKKILYVSYSRTVFIDSGCCNFDNLFNFF